MGEIHAELITHYLHRIESVREELEVCRQFCSDLCRLMNLCSGHSFTALREQAEEISISFSSAESDVRKAGILLREVEILF